jgi:hypothetical protein
MIDRLSVGRGFALASLVATAAFLQACSQTQSTVASAAAGPMDPDSSTVFTLAVLPGSVNDCALADSSMTRPMTLTVHDNKAVLLTDGGIHYDLDRVAPDVYAGGYRFKIRADLSVRPRRLLVSTNDDVCRWQATAP